MSIPFDQIYNFLRQYIDDDIIIYHFSPAGSKKIQDIKFLVNSADGSWSEKKHRINFLLHDQEPLNFDLYQYHSIDDLSAFYHASIPVIFEDLKKFNYLEKYLEKSQTYNLNLPKDFSIADQWLLCHSELNSENLEKYENIGAVGVYWWSHALIAKDWYRFAKSDWRLEYNIDSHQFKKIFNIYNRAWAGTREYRLKFTELIISHGLDTVSRIKFSPWDHGYHYRQHQFENPRFQVEDDLEILPPNRLPPTSSADYDTDDYRDCAIDIVLETLFDDQRWHLTEKTLRPIACGKPFILAATKGSLEYLRGYGFKTFDGIMDESYDQIIDPLDRLNAIINLMGDIKKLSDRQRKNMFIEMNQIAKHNQNLFWSDEFNQKIIQEFVDNYNLGYQRCQASKQGKNYIEFRKFIFSLGGDYRTYLINSPPDRPRRDLIDLLKQARSTWR